MAYNTAEAWQVLNNSLLICKRKIIWSVKYAPVPFPTDNGTPTLPPHWCLLKPRIKNKTYQLFIYHLFIQSKCCSTPGWMSDWPETFWVHTKNKQNIQSHGGEIPLHAFQKKPKCTAKARVHQWRLQSGSERSLNPRLERFPRFPPRRLQLYYLHFRAAGKHSHLATGGKTIETRHCSYSSALISNPKL